MYLSQNSQHTKHIKTKLTKTHLLTDELSLGAFISIKRFLIITSSPAQAAAALTSSSERPFGQKQIMNQRHVNDLLSSYRTSETI
jgi:hypothetical protein